MSTTSTKPRPYVSPLSGMEVILNAEILKPGSVRDANGKSFNPTPKDFESMLRAYKDGVIRRIPVKVGHTSDEYNAEIAKALKIPPIMVVGENNRGAVNLGQFTNLRPGSKGGLTADIEVPKAIHGLAKQQLIRNLSMEILHNVMVNGKFYPMVVKAGCLLGRENPAIPLSDFKLSERQGFGEFSTYTLSEFSVVGETQLASRFHTAKQLLKFIKTSGNQAKESTSPVRFNFHKDTSLPKGGLGLNPFQRKSNEELLDVIKKYKQDTLKHTKPFNLRRGSIYKNSSQLAGPTTGDVHQPSILKKRIRNKQGNREVQLENRRAIGLAPRRTKYTQTSGHGKNRNQGYIRKDIDRPIGAIKKLLKGKIPSPLQILRAGEKFYNSSELAGMHLSQSQKFTNYKVPVTTVTSGQVPSKRVEVIHVKASDPSRAQTSALRLLERGFGKTFEIVGSAVGLILAVHLGKKYLIGKGVKGSDFVRKLESPTQLSLIVGRPKPGHKGPKSNFRQMKAALEDPKHGVAARFNPKYDQKQRQSRTRKRQGLLYGGAAAGLGAGIGAIRFAGRRKLEAPRQTNLVNVDKYIKERNKNLESYMSNSLSTLLAERIETKKKKRSLKKAAVIGGGIGGGIFAADTIGGQLRSRREKGIQTQRTNTATKQIASRKATRSIVDPKRQAKASSIIAQRQSTRQSAQAASQRTASRAAVGQGIDKKFAQAKAGAQSRKHAENAARYRKNVASSLKASRVKPGFLGRLGKAAKIARRLKR